MAHKTVDSNSNSDNVSLSGNDNSSNFTKTSNSKFSSV